MPGGVNSVPYKPASHITGVAPSGKKVRLEREEDNKHDPYAVAIWFGENKLGFIPRDMNQDLSKFLEMGYTDIFDARIQRVAPDEHPEHQVSVIIYLNRNKEGKAYTAG